MRVAQRSVGVVSAVILAHLLSPEDFGAVAVGLLCVSLVRVFSDAGVKQNLIQERRHSADLLSTAWTIEVLRGLAITVVVFLLAPLGAEFFGQPKATAIIRGLGLLPLIRAIPNVKVVYFQRELQFRRVFVYQVSGTVGGLVVAVAAALVLRNVWALVFGQLAAAVIPAVLSYILFPEWPRLKMDKASLRQLYVFGKWMFLASSVGYFNLQGDRFFVGRLFDAEVLGMYAMAAMMTDMILQEFGKGISSVLFPAYARMKHDSKRLREAFVKSYELLLSLLAPACWGLVLVSEDLVRVAFGDKWVGMIPILRLLAMAAAVRALCISGGGLFMATNRPKYNFICELVRAVPLLIFLLLLPPVYGVRGVLLALLLANLAMVPVYLHLCGRLVPLRVTDVLRMYGILALLLAIQTAAAGASMLAFQAGILRLLVAVISGVAAYLGGAWALWRCFGSGPARLWRDAFARQRPKGTRVQHLRHPGVQDIAAVVD